MGVPMVKCAICGSEVTKRQSLLVEPYGRICRSHPEVEQHKAKLAEIASQQATDKKLQEGLKSFNVMMMVEQIRMMALTSGNPLNLTLMAFFYRLPKDIREQVVKQVMEKGPISSEEQDQIVATTAVMIAKGMFKS